MSELDKRFSPSYWTKRHPQERCVEEYINASTKISKEIIERVPCELNIAYGEEAREKYDVFGTDLPDDAPILIYIHGGYWQYKEITKEISNYPARSLYKRGIKTIVVDYVQCPEFTLQQINEKTTCAVKKCIEYAQNHGSKSIGIAGHSAGAQIGLIALLNLFPTLPKHQQDLFKGAFLLGGIFDLTELVETKYNDSLKLTKASAEELSPAFRSFEAIHDEALRIFICVGKHDCEGFIEQSRRFYDVMLEQKLGKQVELMIFEMLDHYDITERLNDDNFKIVEIMARTLLHD